MSGRVPVSLTLILLVGLLGCLFYARPATALPSGFEEAKVIDVPSPTAFDFTPDGRMLVGSKPGQIYVVDHGSRSKALDLGPRACSNSERGLLGVAVDPDFKDAGHKYVYVYYTYKKFGVCPQDNPSDPNNPVNRVSRFTMSDNTLDPASEQVLVNNILSPNGNHNGGDLKFGKDELLYVSVGDGGCNYAEASRCQYQNDASRDRNILLGKVLRIRRDGGIPASNPFTGTNSARCNQAGRTVSGSNCEETFAWGFRNPFRMAFDPDAAGTSFRINDVGGEDWEEIDSAKSGADYGWNLCEGLHDNPYRSGTVNCSGDVHTGPIHEYSHDSGCESITGGAFVPDGSWPSSYDRTYLFGDYVCNKIFALTPRDGGGFRRELFAGGLGGGGPISMGFGPYGTAGKALYYATFAGGGQVRRIVHTSGNQAPVATARTAKNYGPLTMSFDGSGSRDSDGNTPLTYIWNFGDGSALLETSNETASHTYQQAGKYTATLTVRDNLGKQSVPDTTTVFPGDAPPGPVIETPTVGTTFRVGQQFTTTGSATDAEDGTDGNPATVPALKWEVRRYHDGNHYHPWASGTGGDVSFTAPPPEGLYSTDPGENYLQVRLTATDSLGLSRTVTRKLAPLTVVVRFETEPLDFRLEANGSTFRAPKVFTSWKGYALNVDTKRQRDGLGRLWAFDHWSDGRAKAHTIETPGVPITYTAYFKRTTR